jgi:hypothetical protein
MDKAAVLRIWDDLFGNFFASAVNFVSLSFLVDIATELPSFVMTLPLRGFAGMFGWSSLA